MTATTAVAITEANRPPTPPSRTARNAVTAPCRPSSATSGATAVRWKITHWIAGRHDVDRKEDRARRREYRDVLGVDTRRRPEDLTALAPPSDGTGIRRPPRCRRHGGEQTHQRQKHERDERHRVDQRPVQARSRPPLTAPQKKLPTLRPNAVPLGTSMLVFAQPVRPLDRRQPLRLSRGTGRAIVDAALLLAPASLEREPGVRGRGG